MSWPSKICYIFGTRPEAIKLLPLVLATRADDRFSCRVCVTAQHRDLLDQVLNAFDIPVDRDLDLMQPGQNLADLTARAMSALDRYLEEDRPDMVVVQGDTTTSFCAGLSAFYRKIPVAHVEAGLRTHDFDSPWPEEMNRVLLSRLAALHFAPTEVNRENLLREGVPEERILVTGNTVIDALFIALDQVRKQAPPIQGIPSEVLNGGGHRIILVTAHRRENFGTHLRSICHAVLELVHRFPDCRFVYPVHPNPNVRSTAGQILGKSDADNLHMVEPMGYLPFVYLMSRSSLILTDSGGIQEEAPYLGKPVLVMRDTTERPEAVETGGARVVGTSEKEIVQVAGELLRDPSVYEAMAQRAAPFGDGSASRRILKACSRFLNEGIRVAG